MSAQVAATSVTTMRTAQILLGLIIAPAKKDLLGMDTHAQVKKKNFQLDSYSHRNLQNVTILWDLSPS